MCVSHVVALQEPMSGPWVPQAAIDEERPTPGQPWRIVEQGWRAPVPEVQKYLHGVLPHCSEPSRTFSCHGFGQTIKLTPNRVSHYLAFLPEHRPLGHQGAAEQRQAHGHGGRAQY